MIIEAISVPEAEKVEADLCIVGAGPAGLTLAKQFIGSGHRVYVLESGGTALDDAARDLASGANIGHPYFPLSEARARVVGGSSYMWDEWVRARPLDHVDFEEKAWVAGSGWPLRPEDLNPYYHRAQDVLGLGDFDYDLPIDGISPPPGDLGDELVAAPFRYSNTFDFERTSHEIDASRNVCLVLNANATRLSTGDNGDSIASVVVAASESQQFEITPRVVVLAAGGIDNARILLLSPGPGDRGLANSSGMVGRHFMEHPTMRSGRVILNPGVLPSELDFFRKVVVDGIGLRGSLAPSPGLIRDEQSLNAMALFAPANASSSDVVRSLAIARDAIRGENTSGESAIRHALAVLTHPSEALRAIQGQQDPLDGVFQISITVEQAPDPRSRVGVGSETDGFGQPRATLDWRLSDLERRTARTLQDAIDRYLRREGLGHVEGFLGEERPPRAFRGEWHQLGTTRMSVDPSAGVLDPNGRAHDLENLYVAGGSVFPTVGYANPTLTILALTLRLADELEERLSVGASLGNIW